MDTKKFEELRNEFKTDVELLAKGLKDFAAKWGPIAEKFDGELTEAQEKELEEVSDSLDDAWEDLG